VLNLNLGSIGKNIRINHLFNPKSGRSIIIAMDHGISGRITSLGNIGFTIGNLLKENFEGIIMNPGMFRHFSDKFYGKDKPCIIFNGDIYINTTIPGKEFMGEDYRCQMDLQYMIANGAEMVKMFLIFGQKDLKIHADNLWNISQIVKESNLLGLPLMIEPVFWGAKAESENNQKGFLLDASRIAVELGADIIKIPYYSKDGIFKQIIEECPVPIMILGGSKKENLKDLFLTVEKAITAGAKGVIFGRNIWQQENPTNVLKALNMIIHDELTANEVYKFINYKSDK
jgi:fructose-bisphosphate aldolase, class I